VIVIPMAKPLLMHQPAWIIQKAMAVEKTKWKPIKGWNHFAWAIKEATENRFDPCEQRTGL